MNYPDGKEVRVGDLIWWNEGVCVGFVEKIMETKGAYEEWGLSEPSLAFTNLHPFGANEVKDKQSIGGPTTGSTVVDRAADMELEGVGLLSDHEREELDWAVSHAKSQVPESISELSFCVVAIKHDAKAVEDWHISFVDSSCNVIDSVVVPFRPNTRTEA